jgi:hypothetical protein
MAGHLFSISYFTGIRAATQSRCIFSLGSWGNVGYKRWRWVTYGRRRSSLTWAQGGMVRRHEQSDTELMLFGRCG